MKESPFLQVTERGVRDGEVYEIPLERIRRGPVTIGRAAPKNEQDDSHYQIGAAARNRAAISSYHATIYAVENRDSPRGWDYFVRDGAAINGGWKESQQGIWIGKDLISQVELRPSVGSHVTIFPKMDGFEYDCILGWPATPEQGDDTTPTVQNLHKAQMKARAFAAEAAETKKQLLLVGQTMTAMQQTFETERANMFAKMDKQSTMIMALSAAIEEEKRINAEQSRTDSRQQIYIFVLGVAIATFAAIVLNVDGEAIREVFEWSLLAVGSLLALKGGSKALEK